jgi:hypothetical protein
VNKRRVLITGLSLAAGRATTGATGTGWERTPWHATQRAAWEALKRVNN